MAFWVGIFVVTLALIAVVITNQYAIQFVIILLGVIFIISIIVWLSLFTIELFIYYRINHYLHSGRILTRNLAPVTGIEHQLSQTELHRITAILRRSLSDVWSLHTPMDETKIKRGLTSITGNSSEITQFELERIKWLFERGQKKLRKARFILMVSLIFSGFIAGCVMGVYLQHWYHFIR